MDLHWLVRSGITEVSIDPVKNIAGKVLTIQIARYNQLRVSGNVRGIAVFQIPDFSHLAVYVNEAHIIGGLKKHSVPTTSIEGMQL